MARPRDNGGRTTPSKTERGADDPLPSYRQRKPIVFWIVILAVAAMVLSVVAVPVSILLS